MTNKTYDRLKFLTMIVLPAMAALYFAVAQIWGLPNAEQVVGTIAAVTTFLGAVLGITSGQYKKSDAAYDGQIIVDTTDPDKETFVLDYNRHPLDLIEQDKVVFKVNTDAVKK